MNVLVACEFSGIVRDAFIAKGHNAISCDLLPTEVKGPHYQGDVLNLFFEGWDMIIAHPPCTRLANSGVRWLRERNLWSEMRDAAFFFKLMLLAPIPKICVENPIPHKYAVKEIGRKIVEPTEKRVHREPPGPDRWKNRSRFYSGIAEAMAEQWG